MAATYTLNDCDNMEQALHATQWLDQPGRYHGQLIGAQDDDQGRYCKLKWEVLCGEHAGKVVSYSVWYHSSDGDPKKENAIRAANLRLAILLGIFTEERLEEMRAAGEAVEIDFEIAVGAQAVIDCESNTYRDRQGNERTTVRVRLGGVYALTDPKVADVPINDALAREVGVVRDNVFADAPTKGGGKAAGKSQSTQSLPTSANGAQGSKRSASASAPATSTADDEFEGI